MNNLSFPKISAVLLLASVLSCDYGFDEMSYLEEGLDTTQTDSSPSRLSALQVQDSLGQPLPLNPAFAATVYAYEVMVPYTEPQISITWTTEFPDAQVRWQMAGGTFSGGALTWQVTSEAQILALEVKGSNLSKNTYRIMAKKTREPSDVSTLSALSLGEWPLVPDFHPEVTEYTLSVPPDTSLEKVQKLLKYTKAVPEQKITELRWTQSKILPFWVTIKVQAENLSVRTYRIDILSDS